ncbi:MAG: hypothetical protein ACP5D2_01750 [Candidatus Nanoarchaeia archaeon]
MKTLTLESLARIRRLLPKIEKAFPIQLSISDRKLFIRGSELQEFVVLQVVKAIDFGFKFDEAVLLRDEDYMFKIIDIKKYTNRKHLKDVRARVIGREGRAKKTIQDLGDAIIKVRGNKVGLIAHADNMDEVMQALISLIQGSKHGNVYSFLERRRGKQLEDLGLKKDMKRFENEIEEEKAG